MHFVVASWVSTSWDSSDELLLLLSVRDAEMYVTRPEKSLHFLVKGPDSNLHFLVSPEIALHLITG
jgi:hypothetical protein